VGIDNDVRGGSDSGAPLVSNPVEMDHFKRDTLIALEVEIDARVKHPFERQGRDPGDWIIPIDLIQRQVMPLAANWVTVPQTQANPLPYVRLAVRINTAGFA